MVTGRNGPTLLVSGRLDPLIRLTSDGRLAYAVNPTDSGACVIDVWRLVLSGTP